MAAAALLLVTSHGYIEAAERVERGAATANVRDLVGFDLLCRTPGMDPETAEHVCRETLRAAADDVAEMLRHRADLDWDHALAAIGSVVRVERSPANSGVGHGRKTRGAELPPGEQVAAHGDDGVVAVAL